MKQQLISSSLAIADFLHRYNKRLSAIFAASLLGAGSGAFAVASFSSTELPASTLRLVTESVQADSLGLQLELLQEHSFTLHRTDQVRNADTPESLLRRLGIVDAEAAAFLRHDETLAQALFSTAAAGRTVAAEADESQQLLTLRTHWHPPNNDTHFQRLVLERSDEGFSVQVEEVPLEATQRLASATITSSLFAATDAAGIPDSVAIQFIELFESSINFRRDLRRGDEFAVVYEALEADGEPVRTGRLLSAELINKGKAQQAFWFQEEGAAKGDYYSFDGENLRSTYLIMPLAVTRVTSNFGMRTHPVSGFRKGHKGVDYGAPTGTPVRAVADGVISFAGVQRGYGKVIYVQHPNGEDSTVYAHLSHIGVSKGQKVSQGDLIGKVGATGVATGPHLHFEFRVNNVPQDPVVALARQQKHDPVAQAARRAFDAQSEAMQTQLAAARDTGTVVAASFE